MNTTPSTQPPPGAWHILMDRFRAHPDRMTDEYVWEAAAQLRDDQHATADTLGRPHHSDTRA